MDFRYSLCFIRPLAGHRRERPGPAEQVFVDYLLYDLSRDTGEKGAPGVILAAGNGHADILRVLLAHGAPADWVDFHGHAALKAASTAGHVSTMEILLAQPCQPQILAGDRTPLHMASKGGPLRCYREREVLESVGLEGQVSPRRPSPVRKF